MKKRWMWRLRLADMVRDKKTVADLAYLGLLNAEKIGEKTYRSGDAYIVFRGGVLPLEIRGRKRFTHDDVYACIEVYGKSIAVPGEKTEYLEVMLGSAKYLCIPVDKNSVRRRDIAVGIAVYDEVYIVENYKLFNVLKRKRWRSGEIITTGNNAYVSLDYGMLKLYVPVNAGKGRRATGLFKVYFY